MREGDVPVQVAYTKWGGLPHWTFDLFRLGEDEYGVWLGGRAGLSMSRPGLEVISHCPFAVLIPRAKPWIATFHAWPGGPDGPGCEVYIDMTTAPEWGEDGGQVRAVDLDLDVVRRWDGRVEVLDEDEFLDHQVRYGYPAETIALAVASCGEQRHALETGREPYRSVYREWLQSVS